MDIIVWISRIATCILFVVVIFLMAQGERISTAVLDVALLLGIITIFIGGISLMCWVCKSCNLVKTLLFM